MGPQRLALLFVSAALSNLLASAERPSSQEFAQPLPSPLFAHSGEGSVSDRIAQSEQSRQDSEDEEEADSENNIRSVGLSPEEIEPDDFGAPADGPDRSLHLLAKYFKPEGGRVAEEIQMLKESGKDLRLATNDWTRKGHEAIVGAHHVLQRATNDAQTVLFSDALRLNQAFGDNMKNETAKMDAISLDPRAKLKIMRQHGFSTGILYPPIESMDETTKLINKPVLCNSEYKGENWQYVHNQRGRIISFDPETKKWSVRLSSGEMKDQLHNLRREEFLILDDAETLDGQVFDEEAGSGLEHTKEYTRIRNTFFDKQVRIDSLPPHYHFKVRAWKNTIGTIVGYRYSGGQPEFQIKQFGDKSEDNDLALWLTMDRDFHMVEKIKNHTVEVNQPTMGRVLDFHADENRKEGGYYTVQIPAHVVEVKPDQLERKASSWAPRHQTNEIIGAQVTIPSNHTGYEVQGTIKSMNEDAHDDEEPHYNVEIEDGTTKIMKMSDFLYIHHGNQPRLGQVRLIEPEDEDAYLVIVRRQTGDVDGSFRVALQNGQESKMKDTQLALGKLVNDERLENMQVEFNDPDSDVDVLRGKVVAFKGHDSYQIQSDGGKEYTLLISQFAVTHFAGSDAEEASLSAGEFNAVFQKVYFLAEPRESCTSACETQGLSCDQNMLNEAAGSVQKCKSVLENLGETVEMGEIKDDNNAGCTFRQNEGGLGGMGELFNQMSGSDNRCSLMRDRGGRRQRVCACKGKEKCMAAIRNDKAFCTAQNLINGLDLNVECQQPSCDKVSDKDICCRLVPPPTVEEPEEHGQPLTQDRRGRQLEIERLRRGTDPEAGRSGLGPGGSVDSNSVASVLTGSTDTQSAGLLGQPLGQDPPDAQQKQLDLARLRRGTDVSQTLA